jgi:7-dehydrocholesterol reductase
MDIAHDRAGYYLCWGCLNWVTCLYTSQACFLVRHPINLSTPLAIGILATGLAMIYINWEADDQRQRVRETNGNCLVWGRKPRCIHAKYTAGALPRLDAVLYRR